MEPKTQEEHDQSLILKDKAGFKQTTLDGFLKKKSTKSPEKTQGKEPIDEEFKGDRTEPGISTNLESKPVTNAEETKRGDATTNSEKSELKAEINTNTKLGGASKKFYKFPHMSVEWDFVKSKLELLSAGPVDQVTFYDILNQFVNIHLNVKEEKNNFNLLKKAISTYSGFFEEILPFMASLALKIESLFPEEVPLLCQSEAKILFLNKTQCACLLFHMFFCTTISQDNVLLPKTYSLIEWHNSTSPNKNPRDSAKIAKLECFLNYAKRMKENLSELETVSIERVYLDRNTDYGADSWSKASEPLSEVVIKEGSIQEAKGSLQIDFANKFLGGGVLRTGCVQEEITFAIAPEHICGILFTECMLPNEAIVIKGSREYSRHTGYGDSFKYAGDFENEKLPVDEFGRLDIITVAIDALSFSNGERNDQFKIEKILREMNKAYVGFRGSVIDKTAESDRKKDVATGRWGCGVFKGDPQLKFVIQWLACSRAQRRMLFYPFGDKTLASAPSILKQYAGKTVAELFNSVLGFVNEKVDEKESKLFEYLLSDKS